MKERFEELLTRLSKGVYEKDTELGLGLLAAIAGESVLLLGPPGVGKSMVARRIKNAFHEGRSFEYLMSRFSTPDEIFGPVSISRLKSSDLYERNVEGFMPTADVVFLDEIWKAGPAILNTLLTIINEKVYRNGREELRVPMKLLIGASNELPAIGEGLEALWDRFLVRIMSGCVRDEQNFYRILTEASTESADLTDADLLAITQQEYAQWRQQISTIGISPEVLQTLTCIRQHLKSLSVDDTDDSASRVHDIYVSDRRWQHIVHLMRTSAFVHDRQTVDISDLLLLTHCIWNEPDEIDAIRRLVVSAIFQSARDEIQRLTTSIAIDLKHVNARRAFDEVIRQGYTRDNNKEMFDGFNYRIDNFLNGKTYIFFVDYKNLKGYSKDNAPLQGVIYPDPMRPGTTIIRMMSDHLGLISNGVAAQTVNLYRDDDHIYINGVQYVIHQLPKGMSQPPIQGPATTATADDYMERLEKLSTGIRQVQMQLTEQTIFASTVDKAEVEEQVKNLLHEVAVLRVEADKMYE